MAERSFRKITEFLDSVIHARLKVRRLEAGMVLLLGVLAVLLLAPAAVVPSTIWIFRHHLRRADGSSAERLVRCHADAGGLTTPPTEAREGRPRHRRDPPGPGQQPHQFAAAFPA